MTPLSSISVGLGIVFGCLVVGFVAELCYVLQRKRKNNITENDMEGCGGVCWRNPPTRRCSTSDPMPDVTRSSSRVSRGSQNSEHRLHSSSGRDVTMDTFEAGEGGDYDDGEDGEGGGDLDYGLSRIFGLCGPPRFLFTIPEEDEEGGLDSDGGDTKIRCSSDMGRFSLETPYLTPLASPPPSSTPPLTPTSSSAYTGRGFNPLTGASNEDGFLKLKASPPPKFKFLRDAEEKLYRRILMEESLRVNRFAGSFGDGLEHAKSPV